MSRAKKFFKKLADDIGFQPPEIKISPEREQEIIDGIVKAVKRWGMEDLVIMFGAGLAPGSAVIGYTVVLPWAVILEFIGVRGYEYVAFLQNHNNIKKIIERLDKETRRYS